MQEGLLAGVARGSGGRLRRLRGGAPHRPRAVGVPVTELWFMDGTEYLGTVIIRHRLTPALERAGGHIGYHVVPGQRRRGHATQMLAQALVVCQQLGLGEVLVTCPVDNLGSRRVIEANGGALARIVDGETHYWLPTSQQDS